MSDELKERYKNSPEMFIASEKKAADTPAAPCSKTAKMMDFIRKHPAIARLKNVSASKANAEKIKKEITKIRCFMLKQLAGVREHDLTEEELEWASQVLAFRIDVNYSTAELQSDLESDCLKDFDTALLDIKRVRDGFNTAKNLAARYPSMANVAALPSPEQYVGIERDVADTVPEINMDKFGETGEE